MTQTELGNTIQKRRKSLSLKQEDLAELTGITIKTIYLIENGNGNPSFGTLEKMLQVLGLELLVQVKMVDE